MATLIVLITGAAYAGYTWHKGKQRVAAIPTDFEEDPMAVILRAPPNFNTIQARPQLKGTAETENDITLPVNDYFPTNTKGLTHDDYVKYRQDFLPPGGIYHPLQFHEEYDWPREDNLSAD